VEDLAEQDLLVNSGAKGSIDLCKTKEGVLLVETAAFARDLFSHFDYLTRLFNQRVMNPDLQIKLQRQSEDYSAFSLRRNRMRLQITGTRPGAIQLQCEKFIDDDPKSTRTSVMFSGLLEAKFGTFHDLEWDFLGNPIGAEQVARHYLTEFVQASRHYSLGA
jgi:hypothetical protein